MSCSSFTHTLTRRFTITIVLVISLVILIQQTDFENSVTESQPWTLKYENDVNTIYGDENDNWKQNQLERIKNFRQKCKMYNLYEKRRYNLSSGLGVLFSEKYKLAFRPIPKIGSTFMKQVIFLLSQIQTEEVFDLARRDVHRINAPKIRKPLTGENMKGYTVLIMSRNPYSRIFSAYIDKVYILNSPKLCSDIHSKLYIRNKRTHSCRLNISFEEFLDYILHTEKPCLRGHYDPIMSLSYGQQVCNLKDIQIVKQETFSEDIDHVLKLVNVSGKVYDVIYDEMNSAHTESTVRSIVKTVYNRFLSNIHKKTCLSWKDMAVKLWKSFQIQGYMHKHSKFPESKFDSKADYEDFIEMFIRELEKRPLKHDERVRQRNTALLKAFASVDEKYIREIRERYAMDFNMFKYYKKLEL